MMKKSFIILFTLLSMFATFASAYASADHFDLEVYASRFDSIPIGVVNFTRNGGDPLRGDVPWEVLASNLDFGGRFDVTVIPEYDSAFFAERGIALYIDGTYTIDGNTIVIETFLRNVATRVSYMSRRYRGELRFSRNMIHRYSNELVEMLFGERGIFETRFLFVRSEGQNRNIAIMDFDGHNRSNLTNNSSINIFPTFANNETVLWTSYLRGKPDIYRGSITQGTSRIFIQGSGLLVNPDVSPIDGMIVFASSQSGSLNIHVAAPDGTRQRQLTFTRGIDTAPSWSPNGYQIAFTSDRAGGPQIYVMDATGSNQRRVTFEGRYNDTPSWSPRGDRIAYVSQAGGGQFNVWTVSPDGSDPQLVVDLPGMNEHPTWSPDGQLIAFTNTLGGRSDLYVVRPDGTRLKRVTRTGDVRMPRWSGF